MISWLKKSSKLIPTGYYIVKNSPNLYFLDGFLSIFYLPKPIGFWLFNDMCPFVVSVSYFPFLFLGFQTS